MLLTYQNNNAMIKLQNATKEVINMPNKNKIKARIVEKGLTIGKVAKIMGITPYTLGRKISNKVPMTLGEADRLQEILSISDEEYRSFFYAK